MNIPDECLVDMSHTNSTQLNTMVLFILILIFLNALDCVILVKVFTVQFNHQVLNDNMSSLPQKKNVNDSLGRVLYIHYNNLQSNKVMI